MALGLGVTTMTWITGIDYMPKTDSVLRRRGEWRELIGRVIQAGGRRRVEADAEGPVTFLHGRDGVMLHEIHDNVGAP